MDAPQSTVFQVELSSDLDAVRVARRFVDEHATDRMSPESLADLELLVTELVANAVRHGDPAIWLLLDFERPWVGVQVHDGGAAMPATEITVPALDAIGGRGLMIVDRMASSWGVIPADLPPGKTVWFRLDQS